MQTVVHHYDAFTSIPHRGNPAGIVFDADTFTDDAMQQIAAKVGFNETTFVLPSDQADVRLRYFTPGHEMNLCGHATVATFTALYQRGEFDGRAALTVETKAGILPIEIVVRESTPYIWMTQSPPRFIPFQGDQDAVAHAIGLQRSDLDEKLPIVFGSTGIWTLILPVRGLDAMRRMHPQNELFPSLLGQQPRASVHPICFETVDPSVNMHARHFSSPYAGTVEDPVTGTASGVMGAYHNRYIGQLPSLVIEQGLEIGRDGRVIVEASGDNIRISGTAVYTDELMIEID